MAFSENEFTYAGGPQVFGTNLALGVLETSHLLVTKDGYVDVGGDPIPLAFTYNFSTGDLAITPYVLTVNDVVRVKRTVPLDELYVDFEQGDDVTKRNLSRSTTYVLMAVQESADSREADSQAVADALEAINEISDTIDDDIAAIEADVVAADASADAALVSELAAAVSAAAALVSQNAAAASAASINPAAIATLADNETITGTWTHNANVNFIDGAAAVFGTGVDFSIQHDGANTLLTESGTGKLLIRSNDIELQNALGTELLLRALQDDGVYLSFNNAVKFATETTGATVTGLLKTTTLNVRGLIDLNAVNLDTVLIGGWYYCQPNCTNLPFAGTVSWFMQVMELASTEIMQVAYRHSPNGPQIAYRTTLVGVFSPWGNATIKGDGGVVAMGTGTQIEYTLIPNNARAIRISPLLVSANGTGELALRLRAATAGAILTGYAGSRHSSAAGGTLGITDRMSIAPLANAADVYSGLIEGFRRPGGNIWDLRATGDQAAVVLYSRTSVDLGVNPIAGVRLYMVAGNFDAGSFTVEWDT